MKKAIFIPLLMCSTTVFAGPYIGVQYGTSNIDTNEKITFEEPLLPQDVSLTPDGNTGAASAFIGYQFNDKFSLELGYSDYRVDRSQEAFMGIVSYQFPTSGMELDARHETEWDAEMRAKQVYILPTYLHSFSDKWQLTLGLGLTYSEYSFSGHAMDEYEALIDDDIEHHVLRSSLNSTSKNAIGGVGKIGIGYFIFPSWKVGLSAQYQADEIASAAQLALSTSYHF